MFKIAKMRKEMAVMSLLFIGSARAVSIGEANSKALGNAISLIYADYRQSYRTSYINALKSKCPQGSVSEKALKQTSNVYIAPIENFWRLYKQSRSLMPENLLNPYRDLTTPLVSGTIPRSISEYKGDLMNKVSSIMAPYSAQAQYDAQAYAMKTQCK